MDSDNRTDWKKIVYVMAKGRFSGRRVIKTSRRSTHSLPAETTFNHIEANVYYHKRKLLTPPI